MNIIVCIKQVPDTTEIKIDPVKGTLIREGVPSIMNPDAPSFSLTVSSQAPTPWQPRMPSPDSAALWTMI